MTVSAGGGGGGWATTTVLAGGAGMALSMYRRVDHEINDPVAHPGVAQINDVRRAEMIDRARIANLADDDVVADPRRSQCLDIRHAQRLSLVHPHISLRRLLAQPFLLLLVHRMSDQPAGHRADGGANQGILRRRVGRRQWPRRKPLPRPRRSMRRYRCNWGRHWGIRNRQTR